MKPDKKTNEVTQGCMQFIKALINNHHANAAEVYQVLSELCATQARVISASDPRRNR